MKPKFYFDLQQHIFDPENRFNYQTNPDWLELRADRFTASNAADLLSKGKDADGLSKTLKSLINSRAMQNRTGWIDDSAVSYSEKECITRGLVYEDEARKWYQRKTGRTVVECGFVERGSYIGCSPDGLVVDELRTVQIKIPMPKNFIDDIMKDGWKKYEAQCHFERFVCCFKTADLVIYSPELQTGKIIEIPADPEFDRSILSKIRSAVKYRDAANAAIDELLK
jgi:hypothetical protein